MLGRATELGSLQGAGGRRRDCTAGRGFSTHVMEVLHSPANALTTWGSLPAAGGLWVLRPPLEQGGRRLQAGTRADLHGQASRRDFSQGVSRAGDAQGSTHLVWVTVPQPTGEAPNSAPQNSVNGRQCRGPPPGCVLRGSSWWYSGNQVECGGLSPLAVCKASASLPAARSLQPYNY